VGEYLSSQGYKMAAITFAEEDDNQVGILIHFNPCSECFPKTIKHFIIIAKQYMPTNLVFNLLFLIDVIMLSIL